MNALKTLWKQHGTKLLGSLASVWASATALLALLTADPEVRFLLPPRAFAYLAVGNAVIGFFTLKRGFTNTKSNADQA